MTDQPDALEEFLGEWKKTWIKPLGDRVDPSDARFILQRRSAELADAAREKGLYSALVLKVRRSGSRNDGHDIFDYVEGLYRSARLKDILDNQS